jgi:hypothetical protein
MRPAANSFRAYLRALPPDDDPAAAAFVASAKADRSFPDVTSWGELRQYLNKKGLLDASAVAARAVWRRYLRAARQDSSAQ